jgi:hypothetical protein
MPKLYECDLIYNGVDRYNNNIFCMPFNECPMNDNFNKFLDSIYNKVDVCAPYYINIFRKRIIKINILKHIKKKLILNSCYRILFNVSRFMYNNKECYKLNALRIDNIPFPINNDEYLFI